MSASLHYYRSCLASPGLPRDRDTDTGTERELDTDRERQDTDKTPALRLWYRTFLVLPSIPLPLPAKTGSTGLTLRESHLAIGSAI